MKSSPPENLRAADALKLVDLRTAPRFADQVAAWLHDQWYRHRGEELAQVRERLLAGHTARRFPATFVACLDDRPVGTFTLEQTADPRTGLPLFCLSNVFVVPACRGRGIGRQLCEAAVEQTRGWRIPRLSLFTTSHADYYAAIGWTYVDIVPMPSRGQDDRATLMRRQVRLEARHSGPSGERRAAFDKPNLQQQQPGNVLHSHR